MPKFAVKVEGYEKLQRKLRSIDPIYAEPWTRVLRLATAEVLERAKRRSPVLSGRLKASITSKLDARPVPMWGKVTAGATSGSGFRYAFALNAGRRRPAGKGYAKVGKRRAKETPAEIVYHYRGTKKRTRRWFYGAWTGIRRRVGEELRTAAKQIEQAWGR